MVLGQIQEVLGQIQFNFRTNPGSLVTSYFFVCGKTMAVLGLIQDVLKNIQTVRCQVSGVSGWMSGVMCQVPIIHQQTVCQTLEQSLQI